MTAFERQLMWSLVLLAVGLAGYATWRVEQMKPWEVAGKPVCDAQGRIIECTVCPCASSASSGSSGSASGSTSGSTSGSGSGSSGGFPGAGWYCVENWHSITSCADLHCTGAECVNITSEAQWDAYQFGVCTYDDSLMDYSRYTTDGVKHASQSACHTAGCACP